MKSHQPYMVLNRKLALKLSLIVNILLVSFVFIGMVFSAKSLYDLSITREMINEQILRFLDGFILAFLLFEYCFWVFRKE
jgi:uncharacterized protein YneF (UPF0154 family)